MDSSNEAATPTEVFEKWVAWQSAFVQPPTPNSGDDDPLSRDPAGGGDGASDDDEEGESSPSPDEGVAASDKLQKKSKGRKKSKREKLKSHAYQLTGDSDVVGVIFLEISSITDLPPEKNGNSLLCFAARVLTDAPSPPPSDANRL